MFDGRARTGLEDVDRELSVVLAGGNLGAGLCDLCAEPLRQVAEFHIDGRGRALDGAEPVDDLHRDGLAGDLEIGDRLHGLTTVELLRHTHSLRRTRSRGRWAASAQGRQRLCRHDW